MSPAETARRAIVFDMDGVLIDSEPLWRRAEIEVFGRFGLTLDESDCVRTMGLRIDEVVAYWRERRDWAPVSDDAVTEAVVERMVDLIRHEARPIEGVRPAIDAARSAGFAIGLASSSPSRLIDATLDAFGLRPHFEVTRSAENEARGKPAPDVYLAALTALGVEAQDAIAIEDSVNGVRSALAAGMRCVAIPESASRGDESFEIADWRMDSLEVLARAIPTLETARQATRAATVDARSSSG